MLFSGRPRTQYRNAPAHEVICQLRFPTILTINTVEPADFQEAIRAEFPNYARRQDVTPPKITLVSGGAPKVEQQPPVINYHFQPVEAKPDQGLYRPVHSPLHRMGGFCPPPGQAPGGIHQAVQARLFPAGGPSVRKYFLPVQAGH